MKLFREVENSLRSRGSRKQVQLPEEKQVFAHRQARIEPVIGTRVVTEKAPHLARFAARLVARNARAPARGNQQRGKNAQQGGFSRAVRAQETYGLAFAAFQ